MNPWYVIHYIRENYDSLHEKYSGKTVSFQFKDYNDIMNLDMIKVNDIVSTILSVEDGFNQETNYDFSYGCTNVYFPLDSEYEELLHNYRRETKLPTFNKSQRIDFNLEIYFERNLSMFPNKEIEEVIIERLEDYITRKERIETEITINKAKIKETETIDENLEIYQNIQVLKKELEKEKRRSINYENDESNLKLQELEKKVYRFFLPDENYYILNPLLNNLFTTGSNRILYYLQKDSTSGYFLQRLFEYYDFKGQISKELIDFVLQHYFQEIHNLSSYRFITKMVFYNTGSRKYIKEILYREDTDLLKHFYDCMFGAIDKDLPELLKEKIIEALKALKANDQSKISFNTSREIRDLIPGYITELKKLKINFVDKRLTKEEYRSFLFSKKSLKKKIEDITLRVHEEELVEPITEFFKSILADDDLPFNQKELVYRYLYDYNFKGFKKLEPTIKEQLINYTNFYENFYMILHDKVSFSKQELEEMTHLPFQRIRFIAFTKLGYSNPFEESLKDNYIQKGTLTPVIMHEGILTPIIMYKGIPEIAGSVVNDKGFNIKIDKFEKRRFETIDAKKRVIKLTQEEMMGILRDEDFIEHYEELLEKKDENLEFYLIIEEK